MCIVQELIAGEEAEPEPAVPPRAAAEHVYLTVAVGALGAAVTVWLLAHSVNVRVLGALLVIVGLCGVGYLVRSAETRVEATLRAEHQRLLGQLEAVVQAAERRGEARGYVAATRRRLASGNLHLVAGGDD